MKNIITTSFCFLLIYHACMPDDKSKSELPRDQKPQREYKQMTFEVRQNSLVESNADIKVIEPSKTWNAELAYSILYKNLREDDTIYFDTLFFAPLQNKNTNHDVALMPWGKSFFSKRQNNCFTTTVSFRQFAQCRLPNFISVEEKEKKWYIIFPYKIREQYKCLIVYELDTVFHPADRLLEIDPIIEPSFKIDSLYHFP